MSDQWMVRVEGREYGPVDTDALHEWKREGRLIQTNEIRRLDDERWLPAGQFPEFFAENLPPAEPPDLIVRRRTGREIFRETFRIYRGGFWRFLLFGLLTAVPMFILQWNFPRVPLPDLTSGEPLPTVTIPPLCWFMFLLVILLWPLSTAGFQFVADDVVRGRRRSIAAQFAASIERYGRMLGAGLLVYFSYFFWFFIPLTAALAVLSTGISLFSVTVYLMIGAFMIYMNVRLIINFLFWEQTAALGDEGVFLALRESRELARCDSGASRFDRPMYRGVIVLSLWLLLLLVALMVVQFPFALIRLSGATTPEQAMALMESLSKAKTPDALMIASDVASALMNLLVRPLLTTSFIVLYYDAKARRGRRDDRKISRS
jgi:GYF domain 2